MFSNAGTQATSINTINANLGAFQTYANTTFGTSSYSNVQVAAFLPTYTGDIGNIAQVSGAKNIYSGNITLVANSASPIGGIINLETSRTNGAARLGAINLMASNVEIGYSVSYPSQILLNGKTQFVGTTTTSANLFAFSQGNVIIVNDNNTGGNKTNYGGYLFVANNITSAGNVNAAYTNTTGVNATTAAVTGTVSAGNITTTNGLFWANGTNFVSSIYSNVNVSQYLPTYTGNIGNASIQSGTQGWFGGNLYLTANVPNTPGGVVYITAGNASSSGGGTVQVAAQNIYLQGGPAGYTSAETHLRTSTTWIYDGLTNNTGNILYVQNGNVNISNLTSANRTGNPTNYGGYLYVANLISTGGRVSAGNITTTSGVFWSNGAAYSVYGNTQVGQYLAANSTQTTAWSIPFGGNAARPSAPFGGMIRYNTDYNVPEWYSNVNAAWYSFSNPIAPTPPAGPSMWYLAVGGGGSGGSRIGAGGGAGGLLTGNVTLTVGTTYTITVGAGGAAVTSTPGVTGTTGGNSSISGSGLSTITAIGGGGGGAYIGTSGTAGKDGGSGGGGSYSGNGGVNTPGSGTSGQGNAGGAGSATNVAGGGGGGASAAGQAAQATSGGVGGDGTASTITGASVTYAGGGGGSRNTSAGAGGAGGGGAGSAGNSNATAGTNYLGGGGGGARNDSDTSNVVSGKGGDGVVIIRVANVSYSGSYTGSNVAISYAGGDTILKFSASGTYTG